MTNNAGNTTNANMVISGINMVGLVALLAYTTRNISDINVYLEEIKKEIISLKRSHTDSTKRVHTAIARISEKVNAVDAKKHNIGIFQEEPKIEEINEHVDDVTAAIDELMQRS